MRQLCGLFRRREAAGKRASVVRQELEAPAVLGFDPAPGGEQVRKRITGKNRGGRSGKVSRETRPGGSLLRRMFEEKEGTAAKQGKIEIMEVRALTKNVRISPEKARHISRLIQGKSAVEALAIVDLSPRKAAALIGDTLRSAVANAENNKDVNRKLLTVKAALVSPGPIIRRFRPKARGSAGRIRKRTSHFEVILTDNQ